MAPEVLENRPYSYPADMFSLGAVLYQMIYGKLPFNSDE